MVCYHFLFFISFHLHETSVLSFYFRMMKHCKIMHWHKWCCCWYWIFLNLRRSLLCQQNGNYTHRFSLCKLFFVDIYLISMFWLEKKIQTPTKVLIICFNCTLTPHFWCDIVKHLIFVLVAFLPITNSIVFIIFLTNFCRSWTRQNEAVYLEWLSMATYWSDGKLWQRRIFHRPEIVCPMGNESE